MVQAPYFSIAIIKSWF